MRDFTWRVSDYEELVGVAWNSSDFVKNLVGEVNHTTECLTDLFSFVDFE